MGGHAFTATLLRSSADAFAGLAAARLIEQQSAEAGSNGFDAWRAHLRQQVLTLAPAVEEEAPEQFAAGVAWSRDAFVARKLPADSVGLALGCLERVLEESMPAQAWAPLPEYFRQAREALAGEPRLAESALSGSDPHGKLAFQYLEALASGDERRAVELVLAPLEAGRLSVQDLIERVLTPAQRELGRRWHQGVGDVAEEHFATQVTRKVLARALATAPAARLRQRTAVIAAVSDDAHELGLAFVAAFFELDGWRALCLGADTPIEELAAFAARHEADVVALGASLTTHRPKTAQAVATLRAARPGVRVLVGGSAYAGRPELWKRSGADAYAARPSEAVALANRLTGA